jgi:hypothetical protein
LSYNDLVIVDGLEASVEIAHLLFVAGRIQPAERDRIRQELLDYCERDTWAMVKLVEALRKLASAQVESGKRSRMILLRGDRKAAMADLQARLDGGR